MVLMLGGRLLVVPPSLPKTETDDGGARPGAGVVAIETATESAHVTTIALTAAARRFTT